MATVSGRSGNELHSPLYFHPGEMLLEEIEERKLKKTELAKQIGILPGHLSELFIGKRNINAKLAIRLEKVLNISAEYWLGLQLAHDLAHARELLEA